MEDATIRSGAEGSGRPPLLTRVRKLLGRVRRRFACNRYDVFTRAVPAEPVHELPPDYEFRFGTAAELARCEEVHTELDQDERARGARRLELGHRLVLGLAGDLAVFTMWVNPRNLNVPGLIKRRLRSDQWFIYKAYTSPEHRGKNLYKAGMAFVLDAMRTEGLRELVGYAHVKKDVSRKGLARLSFGSVGRVTEIDVPGFHRVFVSRRLAAAFPEELERTHVMAGT